MNVDRKVQNELAQRLYAADPGRAAYGDSACWVAACVTAYDLLTGEYTAIKFKELADYYGLENVE
jgi:hypothetical protein